MVVISVTHLTKYYKTHKKEPGFFGSLSSFLDRKYYATKAVDDISFSIDEGELVGFIGPNGAGKTTTLKCLSGLLYPTSGQVSVLGYKPFERKHSFLKRIALVMGQKNLLLWDLPAMESFLLNKEIYGVSNDVFKNTLAELAELLNVTDVLYVPVRKLSLGQRMKCELIAALIHRPKILFLDEPTIGLDVVMQENLRQFIKEYNKKYHATIILTSHYMKDVESLCKRIVIIEHGKILYDGTLENIMQKYAKHKLLTIELTKKVEKEKLEKLGDIVHFEYPKVTLSVPKEESNRVAARLLERFPVADLNIEDISLEEIIRDIFKNSKHVL